MTLFTSIFIYAESKYRPFHIGLVQISNTDERTAETLDLKY